MTNQETRSVLIAATKRLLAGDTSPDSLTARQIAAEAGTNLAMINYCFKSKDELLKIAVEEIVAEEFARFARMESHETSAREQLRELLLHVCIAMVKYRDLTKLSIPYILLNDDITLPLDILPYIKAHFGVLRSETECRIIAYHMVSTLQLIFYRADDFRKYSGIDMTDERRLSEFLDWQLDLFLRK